MAIAASGAKSSDHDTADPLALDAIESRLAEVRAEREATTATGEIRESLLALETLLLEEKELAERLSDASQAEAPSAFAEAAPSIGTLAALHLERVALREEASLGEAALAEAERERSLATEEAEALERQLGTLRERISSESGASEAKEIRLARLAIRLARERVHERTLTLRSLRANRPQPARLEAIDSRIAEVTASLRRGEAVEQGTERSTVALETALVRERELRARELAGLALRIEAVESRFASGGGSDASLLSAADALRAARDGLQGALEVLDARLERLRDRPTLLAPWERMLRGALSSDEQDEALANVRSRLAVIAQTASRLEVRIEARQRALDALDRRIEESTPSPVVAEALLVQRASARALQRAEVAAMSELEDERSLGQACLEALEGDQLDPARIARTALERGRAIWRYELATVQESPITLGALITALAMLWVGVFVSRRLSRFLAGAIARRLRIDAGAAHAIETLAFYLLVASFALFALRFVHFPLTAFTVAGGALAIGLGFGSQNVMNNFISGLILMLERPVRARDTVEIDGTYGSIEQIGARSTRIRANDGRQLIVPNSFFLESNVVNWTLSDDLIRTKVVVGVAYGSPTRLVADLISEVVRNEPDALEQPPPILLFDEFGNDALIFEIYFWVQARAPMRLSQVESRVRFAIDDAFREHGIVIAFPQRDVHLDAPRPLDVRLVPGEAESHEG
ncbi:MAG: mechanosensitive ion channel [bacterium]|nr:mechanosensitive ion channel [bacterium]